MKTTSIFLGAGLAFGCLSASAEPFHDGDTVVFFGDSITHGGLYHDYLSDYYRTRFPEAKIRFVNSGIGGDTAAGAFKRIPEDVAEYAPTHVTFHFGMNDVLRGCYLPRTDAKTLLARAKAQANYRQNLQRLVAAVRKAAPMAKFTYLTPTPYDDTAVVTNAPKSGWASYNNVGCRTALSLMAGHVIDCAERDHADWVDWFSPLSNSMLLHQRQDPHFSYTRPDRVHPEELGHSVMAWEFLKRQGAPAVVSAVEIAVKGGAVAATAENAAVSEVSGDARGVRFALLAKALPLPVHAKALGVVEEFAVEEKLNLETVKVTGLAGGRYSLLIDGEEVGRYDSSELAAGVRLGFNPKTPQYRQAQEVARRNRVLWERERVLRNHHSARWCYYGRAPVDDIPALKKWYADDVARGGREAKSYFGGFMPGYIEYWPKYREVRAELWRDQEAVRALARPVPHRYEVTEVETAKGK